jgi:O-Antigen ligase
MQSPRFSQLMVWRKSPVQLVVACAVGLVLGLGCVFFSAAWVLGALAAGAIVVATFKRPEIALLGILALTSSIVFETSLPLIPIGVGSLHIPDIMLLALLSLIVVRRLVEPDFAIIHTPLDWPLLCFYAVALLSTLAAIFGSSLDFNLGMREIRTLSYYLTFFAVTNLLRDRRQIRLLLRGFSVLAILVAAVMLAQFLLGDSVRLLPGRVETIRSGSYAITRVLPPGQSLILVSFILTTVALSLNRLGPVNMLTLLQWGVLGTAVLITFNRSFWVGVAVAFLGLAYVVRAHERPKLIGRGLAILVLVAVILVLVLSQPESRAASFVRAAFERLGSIASSGTLQEDSLQDRGLEMKYALPQIAAHPLLGLGFGATYRRWDPRLDWRADDGSGYDGRAYIHNGHLWILLKSGLLGYLSLLWLSVAFLVRGFDRQMRSVVLGFTLTYLAGFIGAVVNPMQMQWYWTPIIGMMMGISEVALWGAPRGKSS